MAIALRGWSGHIRDLLHLHLFFFSSVAFFTMHLGYISGPILTIHNYAKTRALAKSLSFGGLVPGIVNHAKFYKSQFRGFDSLTRTLIPLVCLFYGSRNTFAGGHVGNSKWRQTKRCLCKCKHMDTLVLYNALSKNVQVVKSAKSLNEAKNLYIRNQTRRRVWQAELIHSHC